MPRPPARSRSGYVGSERALDGAQARRGTFRRRGRAGHPARRLDPGRRQEPLAGHLLHHGPYRHGGHYGDPAGNDDRSESTPDGAGPGERRELHSRRVSATAWPRGTREAARPVAFHDPAADHAESYPGIRPIAAAIDGDARTGWSIHPEEGLPHAAVFPIREPLGDSRGTTLQFTIRQGSVAGGNLGRLRLAVAAAKAPLTAPRPAAWADGNRESGSGVATRRHGGDLRPVCKWRQAGACRRRRQAAACNREVGRPECKLSAGARVGICGVLADLANRRWAVGEPRLLSVKIDAAIPSVANLECSEYFIPQ